MKKIIYLCLGVILLVGCCNRLDFTYYKLTEEEKSIVPYQFDDVVKWVDNKGNVFSTLVASNVIATHEFDTYNCMRYMDERLFVTFTIAGNSYELNLVKKDPKLLDLSVNQNISTDSQITFYRTLNGIEAFASVEYKGVMYEKALLLYGNLSQGVLVYSKTKGIVLIDNPDGSWLKRID